MYKKFKELLVEISEKPAVEQKEILNREFEDWRGETTQIDDILVIGVVIN